MRMGANTPGFKRRMGRYAGGMNQSQKMAI